VCTGGGDLFCTGSVSNFAFDFDQCVMVTGDGQANLDASPISSTCDAV
jgi:hypothetical protein